MGNRAYVAIDLGAESGRVIVGTLSHDGAGHQKVQLHEVHRFTHEPIQLQGGLHWNVPHIWNEILAGLSEGAVLAKKHDLQVVSVGVDTWGVDYVLLDSRGQPLAPPRCYRDVRRELGAPLVQENVGYERLYQITGIQEMTINTVVQLAGAIASGESFAKADRLLMMPDYFHFLLGGNQRNEVSIASTSQMLDATTGDWSTELISKLGLPQRLFQPPCSPGTMLGLLNADVSAKTGLSADIRIVAPGSHDTASAVAAVPAVGNSWAYLSSGTWSLLGVELSSPILTEQARLAGFTNERGVGNTIRFLKNVVGLWLLQELRRDLERQGTKLDYAQLADAAATTEPFRTRIDASHPSFITPGGAIEKIKSLARNAGDPEPRTPGEFARCCLEALAMAYRSCLESLEMLTKHVRPHINTIHIVGGGTKNTLLNQMTADSTGRRVLVGPTEATAAGSVIVQAMADGQTQDLASIRAIVARSFDTVEYMPHDTALWNPQYARHAAMMESQT
jgi:rhamnulokinase